MTIEERRQREAYDKTHPWQHMDTAKADGTVCEILFSDMDTNRDQKFFLGDDGYWYRVNPPERFVRSHGGRFVGRSPMNWRPTNAKISPAKRAEVQRDANKRGW